MPIIVELLQHVQQALRLLYMTKEEIQRLVSLAMLSNHCPYEAAALAQFGRYDQAMRSILRVSLEPFVRGVDHVRIIATHPTYTAVTF